MQVGALFGAWRCDCSGMRVAGLGLLPELAIAVCRDEEDKSWRELRRAVCDAHAADFDGHDKVRGCGIFRGLAAGVQGAAFYRSESGVRIEAVGARVAAVCAIPKASTIGLLLEKKWLMVPSKPNRQRARCRERERERNLV